MRRTRQARRKVSYSSSDLYRIKPYEVGSEVGNMYPDTIAKNAIILKKNIQKFNERKGPRVGDYLEYEPGKYTRFTHEWDDSIQTGGSAYGQYYLGNGYISYSGSLDSGVKKTDIQSTSKKKVGSVWFFENNMAGGHRGLHYTEKFRVYKLKKNVDKSGIGELQD